MFINRPFTRDTVQNTKEDLLYGLSIRCQLPYLADLFKIAVDIVQEHQTGYNLRIILYHDKYNGDYPYVIELMHKVYQ